MNDELQTILHREDLLLADRSKRALAAVIDETLLSFLLIFSLWDSFANSQNMEEIINLTNNFVLEYILIKIIYQSFFVMQYGATIGKLVMKIRVIEIKTLQTPNVLSALNRAIFRVISESFFYLGFFWGILDASRQTWHDKTAKTLVINA